MSEEGERMEEAGKVVVPEKEVNTPVLSQEGIMESVGIHEEEFKLNTPVHTPHIIPSYSSSTPLLRQVSNTAGDISLVSTTCGIEAKKHGTTEAVLCYK